MLTCAALTFKGNREINEDSLDYAYEADTGFFVLADGLGGHGHGEIASGIVTDVSMKHHAASPGDLDGCFIESQARLIDEQRKNNAWDDLKTTMVCMYIREGKAKWGHIGDSRLYYFSEGKLIKHTFDHSVAQLLVSMGEIKGKDIRGHEDRNRLLRVLGVDLDIPKYETEELIELGEGDAFLLCSDGFWEWILERDMEKTLKKSETPDQWLEMMESVILKKGSGFSMDNYSAIAVFT